MIHWLATLRGARRERRRLWPAVLAAAPLAWCEAPALFGADSPPAVRLPEVRSGAVVSPTRGYLPLQRWQASQAAAYPQAEAVSPPTRAAAPTPQRQSRVVRKTVPPALNRPYLPLVRWQAAQAETQPYSAEQAPRQTVRTAPMPTLAPPERVAESRDDSPGPMLRQPAVVAASHRRQDPPVPEPASRYAAPVSELPDDLAGSGTVSGQGRAPGARTRAETVDAPSALSAPLDVFEIDLPTTLRLMLSANPTMGEAREAVREMLALQTRARSMMLPTLNAGTSYHKHEGNFQASTGQIKDIYSQAVYFGGGTRVWAAESLAIPAVRILGHVGDAIYEPLVVRQEVTAKRFDSASTSNTLLLQAIVRYFELLSAEARYEAARQTEREAAEIVRITAAYAVTGQGREGDANRARAEAYLMHVEVQRADERIAVASARLAELLSLDPSTRLKTIGGPIGGVELVDPELDLQTLIRMAERRRPELAAASAMIGANSTRVRQEQTRPLFPLLMVGFSAGSFGGGSVLFPPKIGNFGGRNDFDALAVWSLNNMGVGNVATVSERRAVLNQSIAQRTQALNGIRQEVIAAYGLLRGESLQIRITQRQLNDTEEGFREEFARLRGAEALPIEVLNSVDQLGAARQELIKAVTAYNQAQFRLFVAAGVSPSRIVQDGSAASQAARSATPAGAR